ncbi:MAG: hypothetical protein JRE58_02385 [Deltaproteobacteria bacterium]|nr:hypothetical protein [Deltaproteobacteria bacterium]
MSTNYHTPFTDEVTQYKPTHMGAPLAELDAQITANVAAVLLRLQAGDFICLSNEILCLSDEPLTTWV